MVETMEIRLATRKASWNEHSLERVCASENEFLALLMRPASGWRRRTRAQQATVTFTFLYRGFTTDQGDIKPHFAQAAL